MADKAAKLDKVSEFAGFYETDPQKEQRAKDLERLKAYKAHNKENKISR